jgi:hypothetical protein
MTENQTISFFNKPSTWTYADWLISNARKILNTMPKGKEIVWVYQDEMTEEEKEDIPNYKTLTGYIGIKRPKDTRQQWYDNLTQEEKSIIKSLPNFDAGTFAQCTGIQVEED